MSVVFWGIHVSFFVSHQMDNREQLLQEEVTSPARSQSKKLPMNTISRFFFFRK